MERLSSLISASRRSAAVVALACAAPGGAHGQVPAQAVTPTALVGTWARQDDTTTQITFGADSTFTTPVETNQGAATMTAQWALVGDTLVLSHAAVTINGTKKPLGFDRRLVVLHDRELTLTRLGNRETSPRTRVYERVSADTTGHPKQP